MTSHALELSSLLTWFGPTFTPNLPLGPGSFSTHCFFMQTQHPWLLFGLTTSLGILILALGVVPRLLARSSTQWPKVNGTITKSLIRSARDSSNWDIELSYEFEINGSLRTGKRRRWGIPMTMKKEEVDVLAHRYAEGSSVEVHVHPRYHWPVLEPTAHGGLHFYLLFSVLMFLGAIKSLSDALHP
jgi:hypothetical protein